MKEEIMGIWNPKAYMEVRHFPKIKVAASFFVSADYTCQICT